MDWSAYVAIPCHIHFFLSRYILCHWQSMADTEGSCLRPRRRQGHTFGFLSITFF